MNLRIFDTPAEAVRGVAATLLQRTQGKERAAIALSGGSTPRPLYELLGGSPYREALAKTRVTWVVVDERYVPHDDPQSNVRMIEETLFRNGVTPGHAFLSFNTALHDPAKTAAEFESEWQRRSVEKLDVVILGVGDDGHTASLFPGTSVLEVTGRVAAEVFVPRLDQWRVTITLPVIREAALRIVLAAGESKRAILGDVKQGVDHPIARATAELESWWFVDRAAIPLDFDAK